MSLDIKNKSYIGEYVGYGGSSQFLSLSATDRMRHIYMIGKTGSGKSTLLKNLIIQDIHRGEGICVIDPHGDLAEDILDAIPKSRLEHVIYIDPADRENPIGFNPFDFDNERDRSLVASSLISAFKNLWSDS